MKNNKEDHNKIADQKNNSKDYTGKRLKDIKNKEERQKLWRDAKNGNDHNCKAAAASSRNIIPLTERSPEEAYLIRKKAAETTNRIKGEKKTAKQILDTLLPLFANKDAIINNENIPEDIKKEILKKNINITQYDLIMLAQINAAQQGNYKAAEFIRDTAGDKPVNETHNINESISEADKQLIQNLKDRLNIVEMAAGATDQE